MAAITGAHHTSFTVADLDRSLTFFRDLLGRERAASRADRLDDRASTVAAVVAQPVEMGEDLVGGRTHTQTVSDPPADGQQSGPIAASACSAAAVSRPSRTLVYFV